MNNLPTPTTGETAAGLVIVGLAMIGAVTVTKKAYNGFKKLLGKFHNKKKAEKQEAVTEEVTE